MDGGVVQGILSVRNAKKTGRLLECDIAHPVDIPQLLPAPEGPMLVPELTVSAEGLAWHPAGVNVSGITDLLVRREIFPLKRSVESIVERFMEYRQLDGSLPRAYHCA